MKRIAGILGILTITGIPGILQAIVIPPDITSTTLHIQNGTSIKPVGYGTGFSSTPVNVVSTVAVTVLGTPSVSITGSIGNTSFIATQADPGNLEVSASINGSSNTVQGSFMNQTTTRAIVGTLNVVSSSTLGVTPTFSTATVVGTVNVVSTGSFGVLLASTTILNSTIAVTNASGDIFDVDLASGQMRVIVSSAATFPASISDNAPVRVLGDSHGRMIIQPAVSLAGLRMATYTITTDTNERTFISSPTAGARNVITMCIAQNTSATATSIRLRPTHGGNANSIPIGVSASNVPAGFVNSIGFPGQIGGAWSIQAAGSVTSIEISCQYYSESP